MPLDLVDHKHTIIELNTFINLRQQAAKTCGQSGLMGRGTTIFNSNFMQQGLFDTQIRTW